MNTPVITIVTPSFNQARFLEETLRSVLGQGYPALEYIVMDGGSTDGSAGIIRRYAPRLAHWESAPDRGQADAIFRGFERGTGEILGWLNSDDLLLPGALAAVADWFGRHPREECGIGASLLIDAETCGRRDARGRPAFNPGLGRGFSDLLHRGCSGFNQPAVFWRREAFRAVGGFDRDIRFCFDYDLFLRLARRRPIRGITAFLAAFREHDESKTALLQAVREAEQQELWRRHGRRTDDGACAWGAARERWAMRAVKLLLLARILRLPDPRWARACHLGGEA
jgi:glycosyltransferase involved in cell wall biosynthesis